MAGSTLTSFDPPMQLQCAVMMNMFNLIHVTGTPGGPKWELKYGQLSTLIRGEDMIYGWTIDSVSSSWTLKSVFFNMVDFYDNGYTMN